MKTKYFGALVIAFSAGGSLSSLAQQAPAFEGLGFLPGNNFSVAEGISADGSTIVGYSNSGDGTVTQAFRWTAATGISGLGFLPASNVSIGYGANIDGSTVIGASNYNTSSASSFQPQAISWTASTGMVGLGFLSGSVGSLTSSSASGVSENASVVVGNSTYLSNSTLAEAFRWTASTGMVGLGFLPSTNNSLANGVNSDGSMVVGSSGSFAFRWSAATGMVSLGALPGCCGSTAYAVSGVATLRF